MGTELTVTFPPESAPDGRWTPELAETAVGRPFTSRPGGTAIGFVKAAEVQGDGSLLVTLHAEACACWVGRSVTELSVAPHPAVPRA